MPDTYTPVLTDAQILAVGAFGQSPLKRLAHGRAIERAAIETYQRQQWQPIETAPKDGRVMLGRHGRQRPFAMYRGPHGDWLDEKDRVRDPSHWAAMPPAHDLPTSSVDNRVDNRMTDPRQQESMRTRSDSIEE